MPSRYDNRHDVPGSWPERAGDRRLVLLGAFSVIVGFVVAFAVIGIAGSASRSDATARPAEAAASSGAALSAPSEGPSSSSADSASSSSPSAPSGESGSDSQQPDADALARRDADFAVDSARADWSYSTNGKKTVYLTIDDGPSEKTAQVLDILDRYGCKATFFVVGHNSDYFPMIAEAYRRGHTIGLHTYSHDYAEVYSSVDAYFADLDAIGAVVAEQIGYVPCFIRFPGGSSNDISNEFTPGIMGELVADVQARGYQYYDWNLSVGDGAEHTAAEIVGYGTADDEDENIMLLCHDSATKQTTVDALPQIIEHYQALGYSFEAIDRESWVCHHG